MRQSSTGNLAARWQQMNTAKIAAYGTSCAVYKPTHVVLPDLNVLPAAVVLVKTGVLVQFQYDAATQDMANALGVYGKQIATAYWGLPSPPSLISDRCLLLDPEGAAWVVHGNPNAQGLNIALGVYALVSLILPKNRPNGLP